MGKRNGIRVALPVLLVLAACVTTPQQTEYDRQDRLNQLLDSYYALKAHCRSMGLAVVVQQDSPERCSGKLRRANGGFCPPQLGDRLLGCQGR
ncbi:MAG TPA: hypothetical protein VNQ14_06725 [Woeseiaceae bacterium]|nr:hypothetical protein [Woeseiaceae bacterium]